MARKCTLKRTPARRTGRNGGSEMRSSSTHHRYRTANALVFALPPPLGCPRRPNRNDSITANDRDYQSQNSYSFAFAFEIAISVAVCRERMREQRFFLLLLFSFAARVDSTCWPPELDDELLLKLSTSPSKHSLPHRKRSELAHKTCQFPPTSVCLPGFSRLQTAKGSIQLG